MVIFNDDMMHNGTGYGNGNGNGWGSGRGDGFDSGTSSTLGLGGEVDGCGHATGEGWSSGTGYGSGHDGNINDGWEETVDWNDLVLTSPPQPMTDDDWEWLLHQGTSLLEKGRLLP